MVSPSTNAGWTASGGKVSPSPEVTSAVGGHHFWCTLSPYYLPYHMLTGRFAWVSVSLFQALRRASWPGLTRGLLLIALAGCCATVLAARAYLQLGLIRFRGQVS